jgi:hypothetical protein
MTREVTLIFHRFFSVFPGGNAHGKLDLNACAVSPPCFVNCGRRVSHLGSSSVDAINTRTARIEVLEDRIVVAHVADLVQTVEDARENLEVVSRLAAPDCKPFLADIRLAKPLMPEVRRVYMGERLGAFAAMGMLVRATPLGRTMGNIYLKIARPAIPSKLFTEESKALSWLRAAKKK